MVPTGSGRETADKHGPVRYLICSNNALDLDFSNEHNVMTSLIRAVLQILIEATKGDVEAMGQLKTQKELLSVRDPDGYTPLHLAIQNGNFHATKLLLELGANVVDRSNKVCLNYPLLDVTV